MSREQRKLDHIKYALELGDGPCKNGFDDVHFLHNCLPELAPSDINISTKLCGTKLKVPVLINAVTGGTENVTEINRKLAQIAASIGAAIAVGSQYGAVKDKSNYHSFQVMREEYPEGTILGNISALATPQEAQDAVDMINAKALQIHLNAAQELVMPEGDKSFKGLLSNMCCILDKVTVPVIIKETGCGMAVEQIDKMLTLGFEHFDIGGSGGTNFPAIEAERAERNSCLISWGINTAQSLFEATKVCNINNTVIATGGIRTGLEMAKALALGASTVGMAGNILSDVMENNVQGAIKKMHLRLNELQQVMLLVGAKNIQELRNKPLYFTSEIYEFLQCRDYDIKQLTSKR